VILTVGHSTHEIGEFIALLRAHGVETLLDVRRYPGSRRHPQFNSEQVAESLRAAGIGYEHVEALGGRRSPASRSVNIGLRNPQFRGYADHMQTTAFREALDRVIARAQDQTVALMCAEANPFRCHRMLISDALAARRITVEHITGPGARRAHEPTADARFDGGSVTYPGGAEQQRLL
jgi:uncharacterized protein (DUF488 family)